MCTTVASRVAGRIRFRENGSLEAGKEKIARLKLASPIFAFIGDRFVVRDSSERHTIAGGIVLDPDGDKESLASSVTHRQRRFFGTRDPRATGIRASRKSFEQVTIQCR